MLVKVAEALLQVRILSTHWQQVAPIRGAAPSALTLALHLIGPQVTLVPGIVPCTAWSLSNQNRPKQTFFTPFFWSDAMSHGV